MSDNTSSTSAAGGAAAGLGAIAGMAGMMGTVSETIKNNGGSEIASTITNALPTSTQEYISDAREKMFSRDQMRAPTIFFGMGEEKPFYVERTPSLIVERLQHNVSFFLHELPSSYCNTFCFDSIDQSRCLNWHCTSCSSLDYCYKSDERWFLQY